MEISIDGESSKKGQKLQELEMKRKRKRVRDKKLNSSSKNSNSIGIDQGIDFFSLSCISSFFFLCLMYIQCRHIYI